jgi:lysophospholipase L1-like esterase
MGPEAAISLAETLPPPSVIDAARTGTTIGAPKTAPQPAPQNTEVLEKPGAHPLVVFDYTHLGPKGADFFSKEVTEELAKAVPDLRHDLVDELYPPYP